MDTTQAMVAVDCAPWCRDGSGHTTALHPDDQACISDEHTVELSTEPHVRLAGASTQMETLEMYLLRERDAQSASIEISKGDIPIASMKLDEAIALGRILTGMALAARV
jgi:Domain of unknown function (DUF6907)